MQEASGMKLFSFAAGVKCRECGKTASLLWAISHGAARLGQGICQACLAQSWKSLDKDAPPEVEEDEPTKYQERTEGEDAAEYQRGSEYGEATEAPADSEPRGRKGPRRRGKSGRFESAAADADHEDEDSDAEAGYPPGSAGD